MEKKLGVEDDPEKPPVKQPGDAYLAAGALAGLAVGGAVGIGLRVLTGLYILVFAGAVGGGLAGLFVGGRMKNRAANRAQSEQS